MHEPGVPADHPAANRLTPVTAVERVVAIDALRGVAVLGILVMNIYGFAMPIVAYSNPLADGGTEWYNLGTWYVTHVFFDQKFMSIFSMLFGAGLVLMTERAEARGADATATWYRRLFWLLAIGIAHSYLLWFGDVLFYYALVGMLLFPLRKLAPRALVAAAAALLATGMLAAYAGGGYMEQLQADAGEVIRLRDAGEPLDDEQSALLEEWEEAAVFLKPPAQQVAEDTAGYSGGYRDIVAYRAPMVSMMHSAGTISFMMWRVGGLMMLGMALMKLGVLSGEQSDRFYRRLMISGYGLGLPLTLFSAWFLRAHHWDALWMFRIGNLPNYVGSILVAFGHIALVMTIVRKSGIPRIMQWFQAAGRMALTNYLAHSVVMTTLFYGYGLSLYGRVPRLWQMAFVAAMIVFQLWFSTAWLAGFRFGPVEWLWRSLTYWRVQPMLRRQAR